MNKRILTVMLNRLDGEVIASAVCEDEDVFRNVSFASMEEATRYLYRQYKNKYRVILNIPPNVRRP